MPLTSNRYGKGRVRTLRLARSGDRHAVSELTLAVMVEGGFAAAYTDADNRDCVATDTLKNIVGVLAHENPAAPAETFCGLVAAFLLERYPQVECADVKAVETRWTRLAIDGAPHGHAFTLDGNGAPTAHVVATRGSATTRSGIEGFTFMKTTGSGWSDFHSDAYRTLPDTDDRIVATSMDATWLWQRPPHDYGTVNERLMTAMLAVFAGTFSASVQDSMYRMGEAALAAAPEIAEIRIALPNKHYIPINLAPFGIESNSTVFLPTDEPHGQIEAVIGRGDLGLSL